jgi:hypothetical protein
MHVKYLPVLIKELSSDIAIKLFPHVTSGILNYVLLHESGLIMSSASAIKDLVDLKEKL